MNKLAVLSGQDMVAATGWFQFKQYDIIKLVVLIILLIAASLTLPFILSSDGHKMKRTSSIRSSGGSHSYRIGK